MLLSSCETLADLDTFMHDGEWWYDGGRDKDGKLMAVHVTSIQVYVMQGCGCKFAWEEPGEQDHEDSRISDTMEEIMYLQACEEGTEEERAEWKVKLAEAWCVDEDEIDDLCNIEES